MCNELTSEIKSFMKESNEEGWRKVTGDGWSGEKGDKREGGQRGEKLCKGTTACEVKDRDDVCFFAELVCYVVSPRPRFESGSFQDFLFMFFPSDCNLWRDHWETNLRPHFYKAALWLCQMLRAQHHKNKQNTFVKIQTGYYNGSGRFPGLDTDYVDQCNH